MSHIPDAVAITNLLYRYAELIDAGDYEGIGEHLAHAVITADGATARRAAPTRWPRCTTRPRASTRTAHRSPST